MYYYIDITGGGDGHLDTSLGLGFGKTEQERMAAVTFNPIGIHLGERSLWGRLIVGEVRGWKNKE